MKKQRIRVRLKSYDHRLLDKAVKLIALTVKRTGAQLMGPVFLPINRRVWTVNSSPHVDKKAREQFELVVHNRMLDIYSLSDKTMDALMKLSISPSVEVTIK